MREALVYEYLVLHAAGGDLARRFQAFAHAVIDGLAVAIGRGHHQKRVARRACLIRDVARDALDERLLVLDLHRVDVRWRRS